MPEAASQSSVTIKTNAAGRKVIDIKFYEPVYEKDQLPVDPGVEAVKMMKNAEHEALAAGYTLPDVK